MKKHILISGAGVTGLALAYWLDRLKFDVTVIERTPGFRRGGHAIDVRGVALDVLAAMGLFEKGLRLKDPREGMSMLDARAMKFSAPRSAHSARGASTVRTSRCFAMTCVSCYSRP